jgi:flotillin
VLEFIASSPLIATSIGAVILLLTIVYLLIQRYQVAGPQEAFILTGRRGTETDADAGQKVVIGAGVFVLPLVQKLSIVDLSARRINVSIGGAVSAKGVRINLEGVAVVKVGGSADMIRAAAQRFLDQQNEIDVFTTEVLAGALRAIVGRLTVEEIIRDRAAFAAAVAEEAETSLTGQGLVLDTFQLQDIRTEGSYLADLGRPEQARVERDAAIAEAQARQEAEQARLQAEEQVIRAQRTFELQEAEIRAETDAAKAQAEAAGPLAKASRDEEVLIAQELVAQRTAALKERELDTEVRKPADAERYRREQEAEASRNAEVFRADAARQARIAQAQAEAEEARLSGEAERSRREAIAVAVEREGAAERSRREALAGALEREGEAEASATLARGSAEAAALLKKADAFKEYGEAAVLQLLVERLPDIVRAASEPMSNIDKLTVISTDGASQLPKAVTNNVAQGMEMLDGLGIDLKALLSGFLGGRVADAGTPPAIEGDK